jgi:hypothetical protein
MNFRISDMSRDNKVLPPHYYTTQQLNPEDFDLHEFLYGLSYNVTVRYVT